MPRRRRPWVVAAVAMVAICGLGTAAGLIMRDGDSGPADGSASLSEEGVLACASYVAEGRVTQAGPVNGGGDRFRVALDVDRYYKPADGGESRLVFTTSEPDAASYYTVGSRMLVLVPSHEGEAPTAYRAGDRATDETENVPTPAEDQLEWGRAWVEKALPKSKALKCTERG
ncbi:hypothetical protein ACFY64_06130 [Streptomyces collinus]|uniref:hypothetical protein n=1 Tax=Streptomyces collinus TaxID=42684 RepID=UPI0036761BD2